MDFQLLSSENLFEALENVMGIQNCSEGITFSEVKALLFNLSNKRGMESTRENYYLQTTMTEILPSPFN